HHQADLGIDVVYHLPSEQRRKRAEDRDGRAQQHTERQRPAFIERGENQEDEQQRKTEDGGGRHTFPGLFFLEGHAQVIIAHVRWHGFGKDVFERRRRLGGTVAGSGRAI